MSRGRNWTTGELRRLHELRRQRVPMKVIAHMLGRTEHALYSRLRYVPAAPGRPRGWKNVDVRMNAWREDEVRRLHELAEQGASPKEIGLVLGRPDYQVRAKGNREGIRFSNTPSALCREQRKFEAHAVVASEMLRVAILTAMGA